IHLNVRALFDLYGLGLALSFLLGAFTFGNFTTLSFLGSFLGLLLGLSTSTFLGFGNFLGSNTLTFLGFALSFFGLTLAFGDSHHGWPGSPLVVGQKFDEIAGGDLTGGSNHAV